MKKLLGIFVLALMLSACSQKVEKPQSPQPLTPEQVQQELDNALRECHAAVGSKNQAAFDACMDQKGFEKVKKEPKPAAPKKTK